METTATLELEAKKPALPSRGFHREAIQALAAERNEPDWLLEKRYEGWAQYEQAEPPFWRRTELKLDWEELIPYAPAQQPVEDLASLPPKLHAALGVYGRRAGLMLQRDSAQVYRELSDEARRQGVIWTDLATAVREHPDIVRKHFMDEAVPMSTDKYTALHAAFWSGGTLLYVPRGVAVDLPFISVLWQEMPQLATMPHTLLVAEEGSSVTLVSELLSMGCEACPDTYHGGVTEIYVGPGSLVRYINTQDLGRHVYDLRRQTALLDRDSRLEWLTVTLGGKLSRSSQHTVLRGSGAEALVTGLYLPDGKQHVAFDTLQDHVATSCTSDLLYQGALLGRSRAVYEGTIRAWPGAQKTNAYQSNRNLLLSPKARADSLPQLEIEANDLRCTHGATVSQVDQDQVFYLQSRGIPRADAVRLIVEGFFQPTLARLPESLEGLRDRLTGAIAEKLSRSA
ncbi:MAG TPA: Fe-S cluster assembly protein SufD [Anaerolineae bacterium]|nr:Fe-S cluster assembly protein SufD [Anaerolineae bacterium]